MSDTSNQIEIQRRYYADTATQYDAMHVDARDEHSFALAVMMGLIEHFGIRSVLDVGSGTGRAITYIKKRMPGLRVVGVEPVAELREIGYRQQLSRDELVPGDACALPYRDGEFDLVCEFAVLHHIPRPADAVKEMLRVAGKAIFISDSNNFGQGSAVGRMFKQSVHALGLWKIADLIKTRGKGYTISEADGLAYSYSVFDNYRQVRNACREIYTFNTRNAGTNPYRTAGQVAVWGSK